MQLGSHTLGTLVHADQSQMPGRILRYGCLVESPPVILHCDLQLVGGKGHRYPHLVRTCVLNHIVQRFLYDTIDSPLALRTQTPR